MDLNGWNRWSTKVSRISEGVLLRVDGVICQRSKSKSAAMSADTVSDEISPEDLERLCYFVLEIAPADFAARLPRM